MKKVLIDCLIVNNDYFGEYYYHITNQVRVKCEDTDESENKEFNWVSYYEEDDGCPVCIKADGLTYLLNEMPDDCVKEWWVEPEDKVPALDTSENVFKFCESDGIWGVPSDNKCWVCEDRPVDDPSECGDPNTLYLLTYNTLPQLRKKPFIATRHPLGHDIAQKCVYEEPKSSTSLPTFEWQDYGLNCPICRTRIEGIEFKFTVQSHYLFKLEGPYPTDLPIRGTMRDCIAEGDPTTVIEYENLPFSEYSNHLRPFTNGDSWELGKFPDPVCRGRAPTCKTKYGHTDYDWYPEDCVQLTPKQHIEKFPNHCMKCNLKPDGSSSTWYAMDGESVSVCEDYVWDGHTGNAFETKVRKGDDLLIYMTRYIEYAKNPIGRQSQRPKVCMFNPQLEAYRWAETNEFACWICEDETTAWMPAAVTDKSVINSDVEAGQICYYYNFVKGLDDYRPLAAYDDGNTELYCHKDGIWREEPDPNDVAVANNLVIA
ncbi:MAG: hypothetical protein KKF44_11620 [Nanoarchaeota archaeon]|nr:hypothetical protein [Nanoarchaeota archaeon]